MIGWLVLLLVAGLSSQVSAPFDLEQTMRVDYVHTGDPRRARRSLVEPWEPNVTALADAVSPKWRDIRKRNAPEEEMGAPFVSSVHGRRSFSAG